MPPTKIDQLSIGDTVYLEGFGPFELPAAARVYRIDYYRALIRNRRVGSARVIIHPGAQAAPAYTRAVLLQVADRPRHLVLALPGSLFLTAHEAAMGLIERLVARIDQAEDWLKSGPPVPEFVLDRPGPGNQTRVSTTNLSPNATPSLTKHGQEILAALRAPREEHERRQAIEQAKAKPIPPAEVETLDGPLPVIFGDRVMGEIEKLAQAAESGTTISPPNPGDTQPEPSDIPPDIADAAARLNAGPRPPSDKAEKQAKSNKKK